MKHMKDNIVTMDNKLCLDIVTSLDVKEYIRKDIDEQTRAGLTAE